MDHQNTIGAKAELILKALAGESAEARCVKCGAVEWVIPLDEPIDEVFLTNYHCDECEESSPQPLDSRSSLVLGSKSTDPTRLHKGPKNDA